MLIYAVEDEKIVLEEIRDTLLQAEDGAIVRTFMRGAKALDAIRQGDRPEAVFLDIEMPGISGLEFAVSVKKLLPDIRIIFITGYEKYAVKAFKLKVHGYLLKPLTVEDVRDELKYMRGPTEVPDDKLVVRCFGHFDVFYRGEPVIFMRKQSKELLAYLIDRGGAACTAGEIGLALWENGISEKTEQHRVRNLISDLKNTLREIGMEDVLIREHREVAVRRDMIECDYYRMLDGDMDAVNDFRGEYMVDYSWAENTLARLAGRDIK